MVIFSKYTENIPFSKFSAGISSLGRSNIVNDGTYINFIKIDLNWYVFHIHAYYGQVTIGC